jgi:hypothetical protein
MQTKQEAAAATAFICQVDMVTGVATLWLDWNQS